MSSPRPWGCFSLTAEIFTARAVFPTPVGVFPIPGLACKGNFSLPHARGGVSKLLRHIAQISRSSPRPWGCFPFTLHLSFGCVVFPTPVGVFLSGHQFFWRSRCLPHARGGVSVHIGHDLAQGLSSPRPWGCFYQENEKAAHRISLPHARGGVSPRGSENPPSQSVFPTPVGVFPTFC